MKGHVREALTDSLTGEGEWHRHYANKDECLRVLGRLWNCTDIVGQEVRGDFADWVEQYDAQPVRKAPRGLRGKLFQQLDRDLIEKADGIRGGCTYAQLVRILRPLVAALPDW